MSAQERALAREKLLFERLLDDLAPAIAPLQDVAAALSQLDVLSTLAERAEALDLVRPQCVAEPGVAIRGGRTELLRAASREKGPFETLGSWPVEDPVLTIGGWKVQVQGWAEQGSRDPSPTAGWGVSQAAIERVGDVYLWSLAATSIGRGWHTVRTTPGVYVLEAILTPP